VTSNYQKKQTLVKEILDSKDSIALVDLHESTGVSYSLLKKIVANLGYKLTKKEMLIPKKMYIVERL